MSAPTQTICKMCDLPIEGREVISETFDGPVCEDCHKCIRDGMKQATYYGRRAGIAGFLKENP